MKLWKTAVAAVFALMIFASTGTASAAWYPVPVAPVAPVEYYPQPHYLPAWHGRPAACGNHWFRRHHPRMCW
jgi:hypothetical protein